MAGRRKIKVTKVEEFTIAPVDRAPGPDVQEPREAVTQADVEYLAAGDPGAKPDLSHLPDALDAGGRPLFRVGSKIVIERYTGKVVSGNKWLDTCVYVVQDFDNLTGDMKLWNETQGHWSWDNFVKGPACGQVYKLSSRPVGEKKRRGRKKGAKVEAPAPVTTSPSGEKKRRGRPPGSKNRPKEVIAEEKKAKAAERREKKARRKAR